MITHQDQDIAGVMSFYFRDQVLPYYGGSISLARELKGNDFMYWELMRRAAERGIRIFDYGRSKEGTGSIVLKELGFSPEPCTTEKFSGEISCHSRNKSYESKNTSFYQGMEEASIACGEYDWSHAGQKSGLKDLLKLKTVLLFLSHRIPYPPNKGDKIRSFHLLKYLSENYRIFLGAFIDDPSDWQYTEKLSEWCEQTCFLGLHPKLGKFRSLRGFLSGEPLSLPYYYDSNMAAWVSQSGNDTRCRKYPDFFRPWRSM